jgi:6-phosphogluconolactonase
MNFVPPRLAALSTALLLACSATPVMSKNSLVYIATQDPARMGIVVAGFDPETGVLAPPKMAIETRDPAHFTLSRDGKHLYACNSGTPGGVSAFAVESGGALRLLNHRESKGRGPSFVSLDNSGRFVLEANYGGGFVEVYSLAKDGSLDRQTALKIHSGSSVHPQRQNKPYAHWFRTDPSNNFGLVADLGTDQVVVYRFDASAGTLSAHDPPFTKVAPGMGPRHLAFHPNGRWTYAIAELANEVMAFNWDSTSGTLTQFQSVKTLAEGFQGASIAAEIAVHANGSFLYASNRGEDSLVVYAIDAKSGELSFRQRVASGGKVPRYFAFDRTNQWLLVSNQESGNVTVFSVDAKTGELAAKGTPVSLTKPMGLAVL